MSSCCGSIAARWAGFPGVAAGDFGTAAAAQQREAVAEIAGHWQSEAEEAELLRAMLTALPVRHREVVRLRFYAQASEAEIAAALGLSPGTVKSRLHHALEKMRRMKEKVNHLRGTAH